MFLNHTFLINSCRVCLSIPVPGNTLVSLNTRYYETHTNNVRSQAMGILNVGNWFNKFLGKTEEVVETVEDKLTKANDELDKLKDKLVSAEQSATNAVSDFQSKLESLGTIQFEPISEEEFTQITKGVLAIECKRSAEDKPLAVNYYNGPKMVAMKVRWPKCDFYFKAKYQTELF